MNIQIDQELKQATERLITAADSLDVAALEALYTPSFEGLRMDKSGAVVKFTKNELLPFYKHLIEIGSPKPQTKDTNITFAESDGQQGFVMMVRSKILATDWETIGYNLFWERQDGNWRLAKEFAFHDQFKESPTFSTQNWLGVTEKQFDTGELTINYAEGPASGPAMVMLHGGTRWWQDWYKMIPALRSGWHLYAPDLRGHGKSGRDGNHYRLPDYSRDVVALLRERVKEPAVLVGHSLGALTSIWTAAHAPELVKAVVLLDPPLFLRDHPLEFLPFVRDWHEMVHKLTSSVKSYEEMLEIVRSFSQGDDEATIKMKADNLYGIAPETAAIQLANQLVKGSELAEAVAQIQCPVLVIAGDWDHSGAMRDEDIEYARTTLRHGTIVKIPNASHQLQDEHPEEVLAEMAKFLQSVSIA